MNGAIVESIKFYLRIILTCTFLLISQTKGLLSLIKVCNRHFKSIEDKNISLRSQRLLNGLARSLGPKFRELQTEGLKLRNVCGLLMTNLINIELCESILNVIDNALKQDSGSPDCISMFITAIEPRSQFTPPVNPYRGLLRYHLILKGDLDARVIMHDSSHSMQTGISLISESDSMEISNPTETELVVMTLEIGKPFEGFDEMINVIAIQCIATHQDTQQRCTEYLKMNQDSH